MDKGKDPAFLFYSSDFLTGTYTMTDEQVGKYIRLLCLQHQHGGLIRKPDFERLVKDEIIKEKFVECEHGYYNERLMSEMIKRVKKSKALSKNALSGWEKRKGTGKGKQKQCKCIAKESDLHMPIEDEDENENEDVIKTEYSEKEREIISSFWLYLKTYHPLTCQQFEKVKQKTEAGWYDTIHKLKTIDKVSESQITQAIEFGTSDPFWHKNFKTINKLRDKNKDGIKYVIVFLEKAQPQNIPEPGPRKSHVKSIDEIMEMKKWGYSDEQIFGSDGR